MRKVYLENLPKTGRGIDWKNCIGRTVQFVYKDIEGEVEIIEYNSSNGKIEIKYLDNENFMIGASEFRNCKLGKLLKLVTRDFKIEIGTNFKDDNRDILITNREYRERECSPDKKGRVYNLSEKYYKYKCNKCGWEEGWVIESSLLNLQSGCSACCSSPQVVVLGINTIWDTDRWMCDLGVSEEDAKKHTKSSGKIISAICPDCKSIKRISINKIYNRKGISCPICGDGFSYPEKFISEVFRQVDASFQSQLSKKTFQWCDIYRYDFLLNKNIIIEAHGGQHYFDCGWTDVEDVRKNDSIKKDLAIKNGIKEDDYVVIDCRNSNADFIKQNILNSKIGIMYDLSSIDWDLVEKCATKNIAKQACNIYNSNPSMGTLGVSKELRVSRFAVTKYLKQGRKNGWCDYDEKETKRSASSANGKSTSKSVEILKDGVSLGSFYSMQELERQSLKLFGVKLLHGSVSEVCNNIKLQYKGFTFKYV